MVKSSLVNVKGLVSHVEHQAFVFLGGRDVPRGTSFFFGASV
jgi:hypothetical protein